MTSATLLLVDDEPLVRESLAEYLSGEGYDLRLAESEEEALDLALKLHPCVIISDLMLGKGSGISLFNKVKKGMGKGEDPCCILMTGHGTMDNAIEAIRAGVDDYLVKPVNLGELSSAVNAGLNRKKFRHEADSGPGQEMVDRFYHEISAPLTVLRAYLDMFSEGRFGPLTSVQENKMTVIKRNMGQMVRVLRGFHRKPEAAESRPSLEAFEPGEVLREVQQNFFLDFERRGVNVVLALPSGLPKVEADRRQALLILEAIFGSCLTQARFGMTLRIQWQKTSGSLLLQFRLEGWKPEAGGEEPLIPAFDEKMLEAAGFRLHREGGGAFHALHFLRPQA